MLCFLLSRLPLVAPPLEYRPHMSLVMLCLAKWTLFSRPKIWGGVKYIFGGVNSLFGGLKVIFGV